MLLPRLLLIMLVCASSTSAQTPEVHEKRLSNGARILLVERPGSEAVHIRMVFRGGAFAFPEFRSAAIGQVVHAAFCRMDVAERESGDQLETLLTRISGASDGLRKSDQQRLRSGGADPLEPDLKALWDREVTQLRQALPRGPDELEALGATGRRMRVEADFIETSLELPSSSLKAWARLEVARLATLRLSRFPLLAAELPARQNPAELDLLLGAALPGHPYGRGTGGEPGFGQPWLEARALAKRALSPDRMLLILVGDLQVDQALPFLEEAFSRLSNPAAPIREFLEGDAPDQPGPRRLLASATGESCLLVGWRIPPADHPDMLALRLLAAAMGEGRTSRLRLALVRSGLARKVQVDFGVPGQRDSRLLIVSAHPEPGRNLQELALAIEGEVLRLQQDPFSLEDLRNLQAGATVAQLEALADPEVLAQALGEAAAGTGDWRAAFPSWRLASLDPEALQKAARRYLVPARRTEVFLETDPLESTQDLLERQLSDILLRLAAAKGLDTVHAEELTRQTLRQLRMVPRDDRQALLDLLTTAGGKR